MSKGMLKTRSPFVSPVNIWVEEPEERVSQDNSQACGDNSEGEGEWKLAKPCAYDDAVFARHELAICGAHVAWLCQVSNPEVELSDKSLGNEVVTRSRVNTYIIGEADRRSSSVAGTSARGRKGSGTTSSTGVRGTD